MNSRELARRAYRFALGASSVTGCSRLALAYGGWRGRYTVVLYHGVVAGSGKGFRPGHELFVTQETFLRQLRFLRRHFEVVSVRQMMERVRNGAPAERPTVAVTFDDGYVNNLAIASPLLQEEGVPATFFLATDLIGTVQPSWWARVAAAASKCQQMVTVAWPTGPTTYALARVPEKQRLIRDAHRQAMLVSNGTGESVAGVVEAAAGVPSASTEAFRFMDWTQVRALAAKPLFELGSHSCTHRVLSRLSDAELDRELSESKARIKAEVGVTVDFMAYPYGSAETFDERVVKATQRAGYGCGFIGEEGLVRAGDSPYLLRRVSILGSDPWHVFVSKVAGMGQYLLPWRGRRPRPAGEQPWG